jgi:putative oxidoreductase
MAMLSQLGNYRNLGLLIARVGIGALMIFHGLPKITHPEKWAGLGEAMGSLHIHFLPVVWGFLAALTETVGGLFCVLGLWFRVVSLFMIFLFIVATMHHLNIGDGISGASHAIALGFMFIGFLFTGPGRFSVDKG